MDKVINFSKIEKKWQGKWEEKKVYEVKEGNKQKKYYVCEMYPYPSASGLHMGHAFNYVIGDILARYMRMKGYNVLHPMGFDSFGLPAENAAIKSKSHPKKFTEEAIKNFIRQQKALGLSYDWSRKLMSHDTEYYKWNQFFFLKMLEKGLAYRKKSSVNWCDKCNTVLANEQVVSGRCWRHPDCEVKIKQLEQWFIGTTKYADELLSGIEKLDWPERIKAMQRNWIGKSEGTEIDFEIPYDKPKKIKVENIEHFRRSININSKLIIKNKEFSIKQIIRFMLDDGSNYMKLFLDNGCVLADDLERNSFIFVKERKTGLDMKEGKLNYDGKKFNFLYKAHAVADETSGEQIFSRGNGESFWDYASKDGSYLSLGKIDNTKQRLDFYGEIISSNDLQILQKSEKWPVFTTRADTIFGVTFLVISANHSRLMEIVSKEQKKEVESFVKRIKSTKQEDMDKLDKEGVFTGAYAVHPLTGEKIPIWAGNFVVADYGSGMVMAVPAHDSRDFEFAKKYKISMKTVVSPVFETTSGPDAVRKDKPINKRETVICIVKHWSEDKYLCLDWKKEGWRTFVVGGVEKEEDLIKAGIREIKEETGYQNAKFVKYLGSEINNKFFATHKNENRWAVIKGLYFELTDSKKKEVAKEENDLHPTVWIDKDKVLSFLKDDESDKILWNRLISNEKAYTDYGVLINSKEFDGLQSDEAIEHIAIALKEKGLGRKTTNYKLRDWLISRQRYWGTPIPVVYCDDCGIVGVPEKELPVVLPEKVEFGKGNPLETNKKFVEAKCPKCGKRGRRETDTMDTFFDSSWYYLRYADSKNRKEPFDKKKAEYWMPVDFYTGGAEHAVMHLIYARFFTKFLRDLGYVKFDEPFKRLFNQGMVHGEDGKVMSKSAGNGIDPLDAGNKYGIDSLRMFLVSNAAADKDYNWSQTGIEGSARFMNKLIGYFDSVKAGKSSKRAEHKLNFAIKGIEKDLEYVNYNLAIIKLRELLDVFISDEVGKKELESYVKVLSIFCPHVAEELWERMGNKGFVVLEEWPKVDEKKIDEKLEEAEKAVEKTIGDVLNILKIVKEKTGKEGNKVYLYVIPNELANYDAIELSKRLGLSVSVFAVNDKKKHDPEGKAGKAKPGKPGIFVE